MSDDLGEGYAPPGDALTRRTRRGSSIPADISICHAVSLFRRPQSQCVPAAKGQRHVRRGAANQTVGIGRTALPDSRLTTVYDRDT